MIQFVFWSRYYQDLANVNQQVSKTFLVSIKTNLVETENGGHSRWIKKHLMTVNERKLVAILVTLANCPSQIWYFIFLIHDYGSPPLSGMEATSSWGYQVAPQKYFLPFLELILLQPIHLPSGIGIVRKKKEIEAAAAFRFSASNKETGIPIVGVKPLITTRLLWMDGYTIVEPLKRRPDADIGTVEYRGKAEPEHRQVLRSESCRALTARRKHRKGCRNNGAPPPICVEKKTINQCSIASLEPFLVQSFETEKQKQRNRASMFDAKVNKNKTPKPTDSLECGIRTITGMTGATICKTRKSIMQDGRKPWAFSSDPEWRRYAFEIAIRRERTCASGKVKAPDRTIESLSREVTNLGHTAEAEAQQASEVGQMRFQNENWMRTSNNFWTDESLEKWNPVLNMYQVKGRVGVRCTLETEEMATGITLSNPHPECRLRNTN
ncbi:uncharacterized protein BDR25DRAFT_352528 [Lindgomyces ingoldianus]|uniref:Uncharacterized protein n=1 Tax=Lindgomyces ingoldianus TaxID=673940 RepID=A0ACB6R1C6_9PLEO|nr:uncharacterized protein BDR25DRAFT_352528 [Lindgomyces ingoldianus]KAF2473053.1 hypothetical protein BDR25DRAFT_352528 [Lindgomyces ingoldianus]